MSTARQRVSTALKKFQRKPSIIVGTLGNTSGAVDVPGKPNYVYVTIPGSGTLVVYNERVAAVPGQPVELGRDPLEPDQYQVINVHKYPQVNLSASSPIIAGTPAPHAPTHNWSGNDPVYIEKRQLMPLRVTATGDMNVFVTREVANYDNGWQFVSGTNVNMASYAPTTGSLYALVYKDTQEHIKVSTSGTLRDTTTLTLNDAPQPYPGTVPLALIRLYSGQSGIYDNSLVTDIVDVRQLFSPIGDAGSGIATGTFSGHIIQDEGSSLPIRSKLNFVGAGVLASDNAGNDRTDIFITGSSGVTLPYPPNANVFYNGSGTFTSPTYGILNSDPFQIDQSGGTSDTYGVLAGVINGVNCVFTVSKGVYPTGSLRVVLNGQMQMQGTGEDWVETSPASGTFTMAVAPVAGDEILVSYGNVIVGSGGSTLNDYICIQDQKAQNTQGGTFTSGAWRTRDLNTEQSDTGNHASIASNQITLDAGTYVCHITCPALLSGSHQAKLYNITANADILMGTSEYGDATVYAQTRSSISGKFVLSVSSVLEVQHRCATTATTIGLGSKSNFAAEIYAVAEFWKIA